MLRDEANAIGADDDVVGITTHIHDLGGLIEFMAIGTAVKRRAGATPLTASAAGAGRSSATASTWISGDDMFAAAVKEPAAAVSGELSSSGYSGNPDRRFAKMRPECTG